MAQKVFNSDNLGVVSAVPYSLGDTVESTAIKNEFFRFYKMGMLRTLTLLEEEIFDTQNKIEHVKTVDDDEGE